MAFARVAPTAPTAANRPLNAATTKLALFGAAAIAVGVTALALSTTDWQYRAAGGLEVQKNEGHEPCALVQVTGWLSNRKVGEATSLLPRTTTLNAD